MTQNFSETHLVLLGHGTDLNANSAAPVQQHAAELRRRRLFAAVHEAFWKQEPQINNVLAGAGRASLIIVPLFISEGYFSQQVIPAALGFSSQPGIPATLAQYRETGHRWLYCRPVGTHPAMTRVLLHRARTIVEQFPFPRAPRLQETSLFILGHGTERNEHSRQAIEAQVEAIRHQKTYADVHAAFLDEEPGIPSCYARAQTRNLVIVPFFMSDGLHVREDIPVLLGEPQRLVQQRLQNNTATWRNPTERNGKLVWYAPSVGTDPTVADVILERAREALEHFPVDDARNPSAA